MSDRDIIKDQQKGVYVVAAGMSNVETAVNQIHEETFVFAVDADAAVTERGIHIAKACRLKSAVLTPSTALATDAADYTTTTVSKRDGAGGAAAISATHTTNLTGGTALAAFVPKALTLSATSANLDFAAGNVLTFLVAETGTPTTPVGRLTVTVEYV